MAWKRKRLFVPGIVNYLGKTVVLQSVLNEYVRRVAQSAGNTVARDGLDLVHATQDGDVSAFEQLVERYDRKLLRIAEQLTSGWL